MNKISFLNINPRSIVIATVLGILVQVTLVILFESIGFFIDMRIDKPYPPGVKSIFNDYFWLCFTPVIEVFTGAFYPLIQSRIERLVKREGIIGGAISVLLSGMVGFFLLMCSRWLIVPQLKGVPSDYYEVRLEEIKTSFDHFGIIYGIIIFGGYVLIFKPLTKIVLGGIGGLMGVGIVSWRASKEN